MSKRSERNLDMMIRMADNWTETADQMVQIAMGLLLWQLEVTSVIIRLNDVDKFTNHYDLTRTYEDIDGEPCMIVNLTKKENPNDTEVPAKAE